MLKQCGQANVRQRQHRIRRLGLGFPVQQLTADPLQLPGDCDLGGEQVDVGPPQPEQLAAPPPRTRISTYAA
jgi:hypothetical protein